MRPDDHGAHPDEVPGLRSCDLLAVPERLPGRSRTKSRRLPLSGIWAGAMSDIVTSHNHSQPNGQSQHSHEHGDERHLHKRDDGYLGWWDFDDDVNALVFHREPAAASGLPGKERGDA